jgi:cytochrome c peroxidase
MKRTVVILVLLGFLSVCALSFREVEQHDAYHQLYHARLKTLDEAQNSLKAVIKKSDLNSKNGLNEVRAEIHKARLAMKSVDFWTRYLDPISQKLINGPLPVEWETEVFEKFERPYRRQGAGLSLAELYLDEENPNRDSLVHLIDSAVVGLNQFRADTVLRELQAFDHFFLCNRLFLLNVASIYTTGFECPDTSRIIPELREMMRDVRGIYVSYNESFPANPLPERYLKLYDSAMIFVSNQSGDFSRFDHFNFLRRYVNPLFEINAELISKYKVVSHSLVDYSLNRKSRSIFSKDLYRGQNTKGLFNRVQDSATLAMIEDLGRSLFFDPILSGNNQRSCASCHKPTEFFTENGVATSAHFAGNSFLSRNTPTLINAEFNHLLMADGKHFSLQHQAEGVITNPDEMGGDSAEVIKRVLSVPKYKKALEQLLVYTPQYPEIGLEHIVSAITTYYARFSRSDAPFDRAMNGIASLPDSAQQGFNFFMSKAQCGTCHFAPQFNGVKPPYVSSEFEVLGVPNDTVYHSLSADSGRAKINPAFETLHAFRTSTLRNAARTAPYMHNGVFTTLDEVIAFYNHGGGKGHGLSIENQTLSADSLGLNAIEQKLLIRFIESLNEDVVIEKAPESLPPSRISSLNKRKVGGSY